MNTGTKIILKQVLSQYGKIIYPNPAKLKNFLSDYGVPKREINSLVSVMSSYYFKTFIEMIGGPDKEYQKKMLIAGVLDEFALDESLLNDCIDCLEYAVLPLDTENIQDIANGQSNDEILQMANDGDAYMQYKAACMYENGTIETSEPYEEALYWYRKSAAGGNVDAQIALAKIYEGGSKTKKNLIKSFFWYNKAAEQNNPIGLYHIGMCYFDGLGVKKNHSEAFSYFKRAADIGSGQADYMLGECYFLAIGIEQDIDEAAYRYLQSSKEGLAIAEARLGILYFKGIGVNCDFQKSFDYFERAANKKHALALLALGIFYMEGIIKKDNEKAMYYFKRARESDAMAAQLIFDFGSEKNKNYITVTYMFNAIDDRMTIYNTYYTTC